MPSYVPYGAAPPQNPYFPFPGPPQPMAPPHPHTGVNFVQPSAAQQYQNFEQLNTANPTHPSNNTKRKGRNRNNNNPSQGGNQPPQHQPTGGNQNLLAIFMVRGVNLVPGLRSTRVCKLHAVLKRSSGEFLFSSKYQIKRAC
jgi:hypothetical protein